MWLRRIRNSSMYTPSFFDSFERIVHNIYFGSKGSLASLWREPMSIYSVFAALRLSLCACSHNLMLSKSSLSPYSISSIPFPQAVKMVSSANIRGVVCLRQFIKSLIWFVYDLPWRVDSSSPVVISTTNRDIVAHRRDKTTKGRLII